MGKQSAPPPPDYAAAARATAAGNASAAQVAQYGSMTNQVTPYGQVNYTAQNVGKTPQGDPLNQWTQTVSLTPEQQRLFDQNVAINQQLGDVAQKGVGYVGQALDKPLDFSSAQQLYTPGEIQQQASSAAYKNASQYLDPQFEQSEQQLSSRLANQGITQGSEAYNTAMANQGRQKQQAYESARNQAYLQGLQGAQQSYTQGMGTRQQQIAELQALRQDPINMLNSVRTGAQMQVAQMPQVGQSNPAALNQVAGPDMLGAVNAQYTGESNNVNAANAANAQMWGSVIGGAGALGGGFAARGSDRRIKKNIKRIGTHALGIGLYTWDYLWGEPSSGVMADEVEKVMPIAVVLHPSGFKMVNYSLLGLA